MAFSETSGEEVLGAEVRDDAIGELGGCRDGCDSMTTVAARDSEPEEPSFAVGDQDEGEDAPAASAAGFGDAELRSVETSGDEGLCAEVRDGTVGELRGSRDGWGSVTTVAA